MRRLTLRCFALAAVVLLLTSAAAIASTFKGGGRDDPKVRVSFEKERGKIKRFKIRRARFYCTNGERFRTSMRAGRMRIHPDGRFRGRFTDSDGKVALRVNGAVTGRRARGRLRIVAFVNSYKCTTRRVGWRARVVRR